MLKDVPGDGDVPADRVPLDGESADRLPSSPLFLLITPDVKSFTRRAYLDEVVRIVPEELRRRLIRGSVVEAVVEVDAADAVAEHESESDTNR